jgi:hypothetical protein
LGRGGVGDCCGLAAIATRPKGETSHTEFVQLIDIDKEKSYGNPKHRSASEAPSGEKNHISLGAEAAKPEAAGSKSAG